jgi:hypothetical protein
MRAQTCDAHGIRYYLCWDSLLVSHALLFASNWAWTCQTGSKLTRDSPNKYFDRVVYFSHELIFSCYIQTENFRKKKHNHISCGVLKRPFKLNETKSCWIVTCTKSRECLTTAKIINSHSTSYLNQHILYSLTTVKHLNVYNNCSPNMNFYF